MSIHRLARAGFIRAPFRLFAVVVVIAFPVVLPRMLRAQSIITTIAGTGTAGYNGDGIPARKAELNTPFAAVADGSGNVYIADSSNHRVRQVSPKGTITTVAGTGKAGNSAGQLNSPFSIAMGSAGSLYIADSYNNRVLRLNLISDAVQVIAGNGTAGSSGDGELATSAELQRPFGLALDSSGNIYIADTYNQRVRKIDATSGKIATVAGTGVAGYNGDGISAATAQLNYPNAVAVDSIGNVYISDTVNARVRKIDTAGQISTLAGTGTAGYNGDAVAAVTAQLAYPVGLVVDAVGNLYIADSGNERVREIDTTGTISTIAGNGKAGYSGDGMAATTAELSSPTGVSLDGGGNLYITDSQNQRIRSVALMVSGTPMLSLSPSGPFTFPQEQIGSSSSPQVFKITNSGNGALALATVTSTNPQIFSVQSDNCSGVSLVPSAACTFSAVFTPVVTGPASLTSIVPFSAAITVTSNATPSSQALLLAGIGLLQSTSTLVYSRVNPQFAGSPALFRAVVTADPGTVAPTGTVTWLQAPISGGSVTQLGQSQLLNGEATFQIAGLTAGNTIIEAVYSGSQIFASSFATLTQITQSQPATIKAMSGSGQVLGAGPSFPHPLVARVLDAFGAPLSGVPVRFSGVGLTFSSGGLAITNAIGDASVTAYATGSGNATAMAATSSLQPVSFFLSSDKAGRFSPVGTFYAAGSSAQFDTLAVAASNVNGLCGQNHWTQHSPGGANAITVDDPRNAFIPPQSGDIWIEWNDQAAAGQSGGIVCYYVAVDSVVAVRLYQARAIVNLPAGLVGSQDQNILPFLSGNAVPLPAAIQTIVNGSTINVGLSDLRPEDAKFASNRALTTYGATMNGSPFTGVGYQGAAASPWNGRPILSAMSQAEAYPVDYAFIAQDVDPVDGLLPIRPYTELPIGAAPVVVFGNFSQTATGHLGDGSYINIDTSSLAGAFSGTVSRVRDLSPVPSSEGDEPLHVWIESPLAGAYNVMEFTITNSMSTAGEPAQGYGRVTGQETGISSLNQACAGTQPCSDESGNPLYHLFGSSMGGPASRGRVLGASEMVATVNNIPDSLGYAFWSYGNFAAAGNVHYFTVGGVDPFFSNTSPNPNGEGVLPQCASTPCVPPFDNIRNGGYPIWSTYRMIYDSTDPSVLATNLAGLAQTAATTLYGDFVPATAMNVFHSHFPQVVSSTGAGIAANNGFIPGKTEMGGDMGGAVLTVQSELDFIADTGGDQQIGLKQ